VYQHVHAHFCPGVEAFLSEAMDTTPATALGRARRCIQIRLQKSRPYPEKNFVNPIKATTMDEVQLSIAASALQRIHEVASNSRYREALQWSMWRVVGSTTLRLPPLFKLPSWILDRLEDEEYVSHLSPATVVALVAVSFRARHKMHTVGNLAIIRALCQRMNNPTVPWAQLVIAVFDRLLLDNWSPHYIDNLVQTQSNDLENMILKRKLHRDEGLWLSSTLSELCGEGLLSSEKPFLIGICLATLLDDAPKWGPSKPP